MSLSAFYEGNWVLKRMALYQPQSYSAGIQRHLDQGQLKIAFSEDQMSCILIF